MDGQDDIRHEKDGAERLHHQDGAEYPGSFQHARRSGRERSGITISHHRHRPHHRRRVSSSAIIIVVVVVIVVVVIIIVVIIVVPVAAWPPATVAPFTGSPMLGSRRHRPCSRAGSRRCGGRARSPAAGRPGATRTGHGPTGFCGPRRSRTPALELTDNGAGGGIVLRHGRAAARTAALAEIRNLRRVGAFARAFKKHPAGLMPTG
jgi:hypothetical protein